jgi:hypothetical protein
MSANPDDLDLLALRIQITILDLPDHVKTRIASLLDRRDVGSLAVVCKDWRPHAESCMWRTICTDLYRGSYDGVWEPDDASLTLADFVWPEQIPDGSSRSLPSQCFGY